MLQLDVFFQKGKKEESMSSVDDEEDEEEEEEVILESWSWENMSLGLISDKT